MKMSVSAPAETPVICQVTVVLPPVLKLPTLTVGKVIEKRPFWELSVAEMPANKLYLVAPATLFLTIAETVAVLPTFRVAGKVPLVMLRVWLYPCEPWHGLQGFADAARVGERITSAAITAMAASRRYVTLCAVN